MVRKASKNNLGGRKPSFFKILIPGYSTQRLEIPKMFLKHIMHEFSETATLKLAEVSSGCPWQVKMRTTAQGQVLFEDGWQEFLKDNSLGSKDLLFFYYDGKMQFTISVFDSNGCERVDFANIKHQKSSFVNTTKKPRGRPRKDRSIPSSKSVHAPSSSTDDSVEILSNFEFSKLKEFIKEEEDSESYAYETSSKCLHASNSSTDDSVEFLAQSESGEQKEFNEEEEDSENCASEDSEAAESKQDHTQVPRFVSVIRQRYSVFVPRPFSRKHFPADKRFEIKLQNEEGRKWAVTVNPCIGSHVFGRGWTEFASVNQIRVGDTCIFELLSEKKMMVRILWK